MSNDFIENSWDERVPEYLSEGAFIYGFINAFNGALEMGLSEDEARKRALESIKTPEDREKRIPEA